MENGSHIYNNRQSGIELLKILAIFFIMIYHCQNSITSGVIKAFPDLAELSFPMQLIYYSGQIGNWIFFLSSVWFLTDSRKINPNKIMNLISDTFVISMIFLFSFLTAGVDIDKEMIIRSFFPTTFGNNWFITCYLLLYAVHPLLNIVIDKISQKQHLAFCITFFPIYFILNFFVDDIFFSSKLIFFIIAYFLMAYAKKYMREIISSRKTNITLLLGGLILLISMQIYADLVDKPWKFCLLNNPSLLIIAFSLFNLFRAMKFHSKALNYISSMSMLMYVIHENFIFKKDIRPEWIYKFQVSTGLASISAVTIIFSVVMFAVVLLISIVYKHTLQRLVHFIAGKLLTVLAGLYKKAEKEIIKND